METISDTIYSISGRVRAIAPYTDGTMQVDLDSTAWGNIPPRGTDGPLDNYFYLPTAPPDKNLAIFEQAQKTDVGVIVDFNGDRSISKLTLCYTVNSESELNAAISAINAGPAEYSQIDVKTSFTLTKNVTGIVKNVLIMTSNNSSINDGGFAVLIISGGAQVAISLDAGGTGTSYNNGVGDGTTLIGENGGVLANVENSGRFHVPEGAIFKTGLLAGSADVCGKLENSQPIQAPAPFIVVGNSPCSGGKGEVNDIVAYGEGIIVLAKDSTFTAGAIQVHELSSISSSEGTATLITSGGLLLTGENPIQMSGQAYGINIDGEITITNGGSYSYNGFGGKVGLTATSVKNTNGTLNLGSAGTWTIGTYEQTKGDLNFTIENFKGENYPLLNVTTANLSGGKIHIDAGIYYLPKGTTSTKTKLIDAGTLTIANLAEMVEFKSFPDGITPSVTQEENSLYLHLDVAGT